ncbi:aromatic ring-opening dioxygenase LigA [Flavobacterium sp. KMS]|uniref:hypothetical protein n=1 Tax=Flavobacterium sp. KMS TaxID=1566023 RepID=UPI00057F868A|nr:hypothetical protein [Flavobacterium sp. KMS]KIA99599.1 aromatic ring-opening dioxygenase LigA [Flavobacterium sp. KMS]
MDKIKLNFINKSNDAKNNNVVIFQQNAAQEFEKTAIAWKVIENSAKLDNHPFTFSMGYEVSACDSYGNFTPMFYTYEGTAYEMVMDNSGSVLRVASKPATNLSQIEIKNALPSGIIDANCYRNNRLIATKTNLKPGDKAVFEFYPRLFIGVVPEIEEGDILDSAIISQINSQINLFGITSADIVMTGGGPGNNSTPFYFNLENINKQ